jgi:hypothetical protein
VEYRNIRRDRRSAQTERLDQGQPKTLGEGGREQAARVGDQAPKSGVGKSVRLPDAVRDAGAAFEHIDDLLVLPSALADDDESGRRTHALRHFAPSVQQQ